MRLGRYHLRTARVGQLHVPVLAAGLAVAWFVGLGLIWTGHDFVANGLFDSSRTSHQAGLLRADWMQLGMVAFQSLWLLGGATIWATAAVGRRERVGAAAGPGDVRGGRPSDRDS